VNSHRPSSSRGKVGQQAGVPQLHDRGRQHTTFVAIADVAARLDVCERTVRRWIKARALPVHRIGGLVRVSEASTRSFGSQTRTSRRQGELMFEKNILGKASHIKQRMS
jgi:excisionase family DNA binding protein